jgi:hypothetical protein
LQIPFKNDQYIIIKWVNDERTEGTKIYPKHTTYVDGELQHNVFDVIIGIYKQLALRK